MYYYSDKPCKYGHVSPRNVNGRYCLECHRLRSQKRYNENPQKQHAATKRWRDNNKQRWNEYARQWAKENPEHYAFHSAKRRASKLRATPIWLSKMQLQEIKEFYQRCPKGMHVDHIIPLQGENVCGLHVPWNLQYLTPTENSQKSNQLTSLL
jgi:hypothetical protein